MLTLSILFGTGGAAAQSFPTPSPCLLNPALCNFNVQADFTIQSFSVGCTGLGGDPIVYVTVANDGIIDAETYVDFWWGSPTIPSLGDIGEQYRLVRVPAGGTATARFFLPGLDGQSAYADAIVDTEDEVSESNESNNTDWQWLTLPNCLFN
ncbi:MAG: CARDB domain-containing protein [Myxococcota bacterium]